MTTTTTERSTMIAVFVNRDQANQAIDTLRHAGYSYDHIRLVDRRTNTFIEDIKSLFTGHTTATTDSADDWMRIGVAEQDARSYQSELDAGRSIVLIKVVENPEQALGILRQSGAYDIASRLRMAQPTMASGTAHANGTPGTYNSNAQPGAYNANGAPGTYSPTVQPETADATQPQPRQPSTRDERNA